MKEEEIAELDLYNYRIKKLYKYKYGSINEKFFTQRKIPILGWVYFPSSSSNLSPFDRLDRKLYNMWYWLTTSLLFATALVLFIICLASAKTWSPFQNVLISLYCISGAFFLHQIIFYWFGYKYHFNSSQSQDTAKERIYRRARYWQKIRKRKRSEIIEVSVKNGRKRKLEKIEKIDN